MSEISYTEYWNEVASLAETITEETLDQLDEDTAQAVREVGSMNEIDDARELLYENVWSTIDGHQWVIYTAYNWGVLRHSPNDDYAIREWGADGAIDDTGLRTDRLAFGALYADVMDHSLLGRVQERNSK